MEYIITGSRDIAINFRIISMDSASKLAEKAVHATILARDFAQDSQWPLFGMRLIRETKSPFPG